MSIRTPKALLVIFCLLATHCGGESVAAKTAKSAAVTSAPATTPEARAHRLVIEATACWFGGVWNDALGLSTPTPEDRCSRVLHDAYGSVDKVRLERLRAVEAVEVHDLGERIRVVAEDDRRDTLRAGDLKVLFAAIADAQHETMIARRAADRVKGDEPGGIRHGDLSVDERNAATDLSASAAAVKLLTLDAGSLSAEARSIGVLCAADRQEIARGLPKHLKFLAVQGVFAALFKVDAPVSPSDPTTAVDGGMWLKYLAETASAAGHPVPPRAMNSLQLQELLAWGGTLEGFADQLRAQRDRISQETELHQVVDGTIRKLDIEYRASEAATLADAKQ
jgi:hypothetical protein